MSRPGLVLSAGERRIQYSAIDGDTGVPEASPRRISGGESPRLGSPRVVMLAPPTPPIRPPGPGARQSPRDRQGLVTPRSCSASPRLRPGLFSTRAAFSPKKNPLPAASRPFIDEGEVRASAAAARGGYQEYFDFVETSWFQALSACAIVVNVVSMLVEESEGTNRVEACFWPDQIVLCFFVTELFSRAVWFREQLLCGDPHFVAWNVVDVVVVVAGVLSQWLLPCLMPHEPHPVQLVLQGCRVLRVFRVLKIIRIILKTDLTWTEEGQFQSFIGAVIAYNGIQMGLETDIAWSGWFFMEQVMLCIYVFELAVRVKHSGAAFVNLKNPDLPWNILDLVIVNSSVLDTWIVPLVGLLSSFFDQSQGHTSGKESASGLSVSQFMMLMRMIRLLRILRLIRIIKAVRPLYELVTGVMDALQGVGWVLVLTLVVLYCLGILATRLIGHGLIFGVPEDEAPQLMKLEEVPFRSVPESMFTLFRVMSGAASDTELEALDDLMADLPLLKVGFVLVMIATSWTLLSILTAVVSENMITSTGKQEEEMRNACAEESRRDVVRELTELFIAADTGGNGIVERAELQVFCNDRTNALQVAHTCHVPVKDVQDVLASLHDLHDEDPPLENFVECLVDVGKPAMEKSILRVEARMEALHRKTTSIIAGTLANFEERIISQVHTHLRREVDAAVARMEVGQSRSDAAMESLNRGVHVHQELDRAGARRSAEDAEGIRSTLEAVSAQQRRSGEVLGGIQSAVKGFERRTVTLADDVAARLQAVLREARSSSAAVHEAACSSSASYLDFAHEVPSAPTPLETIASSTVPEHAPVGGAAGRPQVFLGFQEPPGEALGSPTGTCDAADDAAGVRRRGAAEPPSGTQETLGSRAAGYRQPQPLAEEPPS